MAHCYDLRLPTSGTLALIAYSRQLAKCVRIHSSFAPCAAALALSRRLVVYRSESAPVVGATDRMRGFASPFSGSRWIEPVTITIRKTSLDRRFSAVLKKRVRI